MKAFWIITFVFIIQACNITTTGPEVQVEYIAHASFKISYNGKSLLLDPYADKIWIGYKFPKNIIADAVLITHPHYDHDGGRFRGGHPYWESQMEIIEEPGSYQVGEFKITGLTGKHSDPYGKEFDQKNTIWIIQVGGMKFVHLGDNGPLLASHYQAIGAPDFLMVAIDSDFHILKADELEIVLSKLNPTVIIPMHYRLPDLEEEGFPKGGLGNIDPYLTGKENVVQIDGNKVNLSLKNLPEKQKIYVFQHSPDVEK